MHNQRYQSIRTFSVTLLVMSLFLMGASMVKPAPVAAQRGVPDFVPEQSPAGIINRGNRFSADLEATKTVDVETAATGDMVHYTVWIENLGPHSTAKVQATDHLPDCLIDTSWETTRGTYDGWFWDIGALKVGEMVKLEVWATVGPDCTGRVTNGVWVRSSLPDPSTFFNLFGVPPPTLKNNHAEASFLTPNADMNDRFATQKGATGSARVELTQIGGIKIGQVKMWGLPPNQPYLVQVTVVPPGGEFTPDGVTVHPKMATTDNDGHFQIDDFDLGVFPPGPGYRVDIFVTTDPASGVGAAGVGVFLTGLLGGDPLAACQPFWNIEVTGATGFARVEIDRGGQVLDGTTFELGRNYPNPFNPTTIVPFSLAEAAHVSVRVYDLLGREVSVLVDGQLSAGVHEVVFEANNLSTGVYLIRMVAAGKVQIQRVTLMK